VAGDELVEAVDEHRRSDRPQGASDRLREPHLGEERHAASRVAGNRRPVGKDEPPAVTALVFRHSGKEGFGFVIGEWEQSELFASV
jgi:hypothetical protein